MLALAALLAALLGVFLSGAHANNTTGPTVVLDYGSFVGTTNATSGIVYYRGVRFADPPVGILRWRAPVTPPTINQGIVDASQYSLKCISAHLPSDTIPADMSEDCLFGNVYVPLGTNSTSNLPVLVYYHGGGYQSGSSRSAPPEWIMRSAKSPFIFVTFQYRIGPFGFLAGAPVFNDGVSNAGLLDQRASLRWVQRYISFFGGDKSRVTIWGQSAGAGLTMFQLVANGGDNEGLFSQAMGDSPASSAMPRYDSPEVTDLFNRFATMAGCDVLSPYVDVMPCLRAANVSTLAAAGNLTVNGYNSKLFPYSPIIDGVFIQEPVVEAFRNGRFARVPVFYGTNTNEGANWSSRVEDPVANTGRPGSTEYTVYSFLRGQYPGITTDSFKRAMTLYPIQAYNNSIDRQGQQMYGELRYICTGALIAGALSDAGSTAYQYHYDNPHLGSFHHYELQAMFSTEETDFPPDAADLKLFESMRQYWTSFSSTGKPYADGAPDWGTVAMDNGSPRMLFNPQMIAMEDMGAQAERCEFWHSIRDELVT